MSNRTTQVYLFSFGKSFCRTNKNNLRKKKQVDALKRLKPTEQKLTKIKDTIPEDQLNEESKNEIEKIKYIK